MTTYMPQKAGVLSESRSRPASQLRRLYLRTGLNSRADGSSYFESERLKVLCTVYGPRATNKPEYTERAEVRCDIKLASFAGRERKPPGQTDEERSWSAALQATLEAVIVRERYPKSVVDVFVLVLERDGSELAAAITAASLALADGGVEMHDLVTAVTVASGPEGLLVDLSAADEERVSGGLTVASLAASNAVVQMHSLSGSLPGGGSQGVPAFLALALDANVQLRDLCRLALRPKE